MEAAFGSSKFYCNLKPAPILEVFFGLEMEATFWLDFRFFEEICMAYRTSKNLSAAETNMTFAMQRHPSNIALHCMRTVCLKGCLSHCNMFRFFLSIGFQTSYAIVYFKHGK